MLSAAMVLEAVEVACGGDGAILPDGELTPSSCCDCMRKHECVSAHIIERAAHLKRDGKSLVGGKSMHMLCLGFYCR